jgi:hypothetical protein
MVRGNRQQRGHLPGQILPPQTHQRRPQDGLPTLGNARARKISLIEALDTCRECHRLAPFCFYNGNTFAGIAWAMIYPLLQKLDASTALTARNAAGHYVAGTIGRSEMQQVVKALEAK